MKKSTKEGMTAGGIWGTMLGGPLGLVTGLAIGGIFGGLAIRKEKKKTQRAKDKAEWMDDLREEWATKYHRLLNKK
jgi:hypothetical protein